MYRNCCRPQPQVDVPSASAKHETPSPPAPGAFELSDGAEPPPSTKNTDTPRIVTSSAKESGLECIKSGELIGDDAELVELRTANGRCGERASNICAEARGIRSRAVIVLKCVVVWEQESESHVFSPLFAAPSKLLRCHKVWPAS